MDVRRCYLGDGGCRLLLIRFVTRLAPGFGRALLSFLRFSATVFFVGGVGRFLPPEPSGAGRPRFGPGLVGCRLGCGGGSLDLCCRLFRPVNPGVESAGHRLSPVLPPVFALRFAGLTLGGLLGPFGFFGCRIRRHVRRG